MARILILIAGPLWSNPRTQKEAQALAGAGHEVRVSGIWYDHVAAERDMALSSGRAWTFSPFLDFRTIGVAPRVERAVARVASGMARASFELLGWRSPRLLGYSPTRMLRQAARHPADLTIVRSELGLWIGASLLDYGKRVGLDFEDWYSENYLPGAGNPRRVGWIKSLERRLAKACAYCVASSHAMAEAIAEEYRVRPPTVVYNVFPSYDVCGLPAQESDRKNLGAPSIHWFSQTIGPDRGLEIFFRAAEQVALPFEIHLRGNVGAHSRWLNCCLRGNLRGRTFVHDTVSNDSLPGRIAQHDIGLALENAAIRSRDLTITNKLFQYLQAGLAVIATDTAGQREVFERAPNVGLLVRNDDVAAMKNALTQLLCDRDRLDKTKKAALSAFNEKFAWEDHRHAIVELADQALAQNAPASARKAFSG